VRWIDLSSRMPRVRDKDSALPDGQFVIKSENSDGTISVFTATLKTLSLLVKSPHKCWWLKGAFKEELQ
jgi:hypothetical protein